MEEQINISDLSSEEIGLLINQKHLEMYNCDVAIRTLTKELLERKSKEE